LFYKRILELCDKQNIKITTLIENFDMSSGNLSRWKGGTNPNSEILVKFAEYFNVSTDYLLGIEKPAQKNERVLSENELKIRKIVADFTPEEFAKVQDYLEFVKSQRNQ